ncbi:MAG: isoprenylcysteine carboxylmethyltransferase family protein [Pyrinomonadaceae bacterium]
MEKLSYYVTAASFTIVLVCWFIFAGLFILKKRAEKAPDAVKAPKSWLGLGLQGISYAFVWAVMRQPLLSSFTGEYYLLNIVLQVAAVALSTSSVILTMSAIRELGKQWSLQARLVEGHKLITSGPYSLVRHPIYTAMLGKLIATGIVLSYWFVLVPAVAVFLIGTFVRTRFEEKLLSDAFGQEFERWKAKVPGLIPTFRG